MVSDMCCSPDVQKMNLTSSKPHFFNDFSFTSRVLDSGDAIIDYGMPIRSWLIM